MNETKDYVISNNKFVFKPQFNNQISNYIDLMSVPVYNELIFADYCNINIFSELNYLNNFYPGYQIYYTK